MAYIYFPRIGRSSGTDSRSHVQPLSFRHAAMLSSIPFHQPAKTTITTRDGARRQESDQVKSIYAAIARTLHYEATVYDNVARSNKTSRDNIYAWRLFNNTSINMKIWRLYPTAAWNPKPGSTHRPDRYVGNSATAYALTTPATWRVQWLGASASPENSWIYIESSRCVAREPCALRTPYIYRCWSHHHHHHHQHSLGRSSRSRWTCIVERCVCASSCRMSAHRITRYMCIYSAKQYKQYMNCIICRKSR